MDTIRLYKARTSILPLILIKPTFSKFVNFVVGDMNIKLIWDMKSVDVRYVQVFSRKLLLQPSEHTSRLKFPTCALNSIASQTILVF